MSIDAISNFLTVIRNGVSASKPSVVVPFSKIKYEIASILKDEGFIRDFVVIDEDKVKKSLQISLKYSNGESVIHEIARVSTPGRRSYAGATNVEAVIGGLGISILSTNRGMLSNKKARELNIGGEIICTVW